VDNTATGYHRLFRLVSPQIDVSRVVMKVAATFEGLQACRELSTHGIKTLATTVFTMEQAILAAEAGCTSISPFVHELKAGFDST
jgi:transaldolase